MRKQLREIVGALGRQASQDVFQIAIRVMTVELRRSDQAHDGGTTLARTKRSGEQPVRPFMLISA